MKNLVWLLCLLSIVALGETHHAKGFKRHEEFRRKMKNSEIVFSATTGIETNIPKSATTQDCATPVENQGQCGDCWDFSLTGTLRDTRACNGHDPGRLSFMYLLDCATEQSGCNGGDFNAAEHMLSPDGPPHWDSWPYTGHDGGHCMLLPAVTSAASYHMLGANGVPSFRDIAFVISKLHRPVSTDVAADVNWEVYGGGIYSLCDAGPDQIDHMVIISGYDCETAVDASGNCAFDKNGNLPNGIGTYTIKNSWGTNWGENGYMRTKATGKDGSKCNAVATDALFYDLQGATPALPANAVKAQVSVPAWVWYIVIALVALVGGVSIWICLKRTNSNLKK